MTTQYPEYFARFYDTIYHSQRDGVDNEFFQKEISKTKGRVLECGVGTGRLFTEALKNGADIHGIDISPSMLKILKGKLDKKDHHRITLQNMLDFSFRHKFDLIIAPFRVIMHLIEKDDQLRAINNVYNHLKKGGRFVFDTFVPDLNQLIKGLNNVTDFDGEYLPGKRLKRIVSTTPDLINQIINVKFAMEWDEDDQNKRDEWMVPLRYYFRFELEHLIERSSFRNYAILGDYDGNGLSNLSKEFIVVCQK